MTTCTAVAAGDTHSLLLLSGCKLLKPLRPGLGGPSGSPQGDRRVIFGDIAPQVVTLFLMCSFVDVMQYRQGSWVESPTSDAKFCDGRFVGCGE